MLLSPFSIRISPLDSCTGQSLRIRCIDIILRADFFMNSIVAYIFLGVSLAAPIGPVNAAQLDTGIKNGFFHAWIFGIGALTADVL